MTEHEALNDLEVALGMMPCESEEVLKADLGLLSDIHEYRVIRDQIKMAEAKKKQIADRISKTMGKRAFAVDDDGIVVCTYKENQPAIKFDMESFERDYPQLHLQYLYESKTVVRPLRVK
jgi:hypothetical protein